MPAMRLVEVNLTVSEAPLPDKVDVKGKKYIELLVDGTEGVMYSYGPLGLKVDEGKPGGENAFALSDDRGLPARLVADEVRGAPESVVDELREDHGLRP